MKYFSSSLQFSRFLKHLSLSVFCLCFLVCPESLAAQQAIVLAEKAIVYADQEMTSPLGYLVRGKKVKVGDTRLNNHTVYAFVLRGKVAYISAVDVSTELDSTDYAGNLIGVRFAQEKKPRFKSRYALSYVNYASQIKTDVDNGNLQNNDGVDWTGLSLRFNRAIKKNLDGHLLLNYIWSSNSTEKFRMTEIGPGVGFKIYERSRLTLKWDVDLLLIPYASYAYSGLFRVNGFGISAGTGVTGTYLFGSNWGMEAYGGFYYTKLFGFNVPGPYQNISPVFYGARFGIGLNYFY